MKIRTICKDYIVRGRHFTVILQDGFYCAIDEKYIDKNGCLTQTLNGFHTFADRNLETCLNRVRDRVEIDYLESTGMSKAEAFATHFGMLERLAELEEMFAK